MSSQQHNIIQYLTGGERLAFPDTYLQLQLLLVIPMILFIFWPKRLLHNTPHLFRFVWWASAVLLVISFIQGAIWDNLGASRGVWIFDSKNMIGHIGWIPIEEYLCIINDMLFTTIFTLWIWTLKTDHPRLFKEYEVSAGVIKVAKYIMIAGFLFLGALGWRLLLSGKEQYLFFGIILGFFGPFLALEWGICGGQFFRHPLAWLSSWIIPGIYTYLFDSLAVNQGIWVFDYKFTTNTWLGGVVNFEVLLVYVTICVAVSQPIFWGLAYFDRKHRESATG